MIAIAMKEINYNFVQELHLQPRGTRGESGGQTGITYDISNKHRLGYTEVELVQKMIDGTNATLSRLSLTVSVVRCKHSVERGQGAGDQARGLERPARNSCSRVLDA